MSITGGSIVAEAQKLGKAAQGYELGGVGPAFYDCSGLVQKTLSDLGVSGVPRTSEEQYAWATKISASDLQPGDLVFAQFAGDDASPGHVGIYVGNGEVYSAQDPALGIGNASLASWSGNIVGYGRVPGSSGGGSASSSGGLLGDLGAIGSLASSATSLVSDLDDVTKVFSYLSAPGHWFRIGAFFAGLAIMGTAIWIMMGSPTPHPTVVPIPV
jgi:NlpC/P60 family